jgi:hypothetical protein
VNLPRDHDPQSRGGQVVKVKVVCALITLTAGGVLIGVGPAAAAGSLDATFGAGGEVLTGLSGQALPSDAVLQPNGDILVAVEGSGSFGVLRYLPNGSLDTGFGTDGVAASGSLGDVRTLGVDASGDVFVLPGAVELSPAGQLAASVTAKPIVASSVGGAYAFLPDGTALDVFSLVHAVLMGAVNRKVG